MDSAPLAQPVAPPAGSSTPSAGTGAACSCGYDRNHAMVSPSATYSFIGWCAILTGVSWEPKTVSFVCRRCSETVETVADPVEMKKIRLFG
jgi:hypothetical protein